VRESHRRLLSGVLALGAVGFAIWQVRAGDLALPDASTAASASVTVAGYVFLLATSGYVVRTALWYAGADVTEEVADTGRAAGKIGNVLVLTLTVLGAYTALGLVFTAKSIVRWQDMTSENTSYYLTGSVANITYSFVFGVVLAGVVPLVPPSRESGRYPSVTGSKTVAATSVTTPCSASAT